MIKKFLTILLVAAITLSFSACSLAVPDDGGDGNNLLAFGSDKDGGLFRRNMRRGGQCAYPYRF